MNLFEVETWDPQQYIFIGEVASKFLFLYLFLCINSKCKQLSNWFYRGALGSAALKKRIYLDHLKGKLERVAIFLLSSLPQVCVASLFIWLVWKQPLWVWVLFEVKGSLGFLCKLCLLLWLWTWQHNLLNGFKYAIAQMTYRWISIYGVFWSATPIVGHLDIWVTKTEAKTLSHHQALAWMIGTTSMFILLFWLRAEGLET